MKKKKEKSSNNVLSKAEKEKGKEPQQCTIKG